MTTATQLSSLAAKASSAPVRQPTNASLPILGPVTTPIVHAFSAAPAGLSPAQRAAHTRAQRAAGIQPAKPDQARKPASTGRDDGLALVMTVDPAGDGLAVGFGFRSEAGPVQPSAFPETERALQFVRITCPRDSAGELVPADGLSFSGTATANELAAILPVLRRADASLLHAYEESEDPSFPQMVLTLAGIMRVDGIELRQPDGSVTMAKRGAAYIAAFKASEAYRPRA